ncbi:Ctr copper transporter family-domain-containing protein [Aspergillus granulosus]|uniref:Copper transport protein n=1 Tax=Aspergillus granulosus TaxID=176169 RepID=A0ABR4I0D5_9EURO
MDMDMDMTSSSTTTSMAASTTTGMAGMTSSTDSSMAGMDMSSMSMSDMSMTFFTSYKTLLFSNSWSPTTQGQYAGTCIFLIVLAIILRFMIALRPILERRVWNDGPRGAVHGASDTSLEKAALEKPGRVTVTQEIRSRSSNWKVNCAGGRATYEVVVAGVAYLLMLAVMTMNVGYFLSVLGGIWLGTFILGALAADTHWSHS